MLDGNSLDCILIDRIGNYLIKDIEESEIYNAENILRAFVIPPTPRIGKNTTNNKILVQDVKSDSTSELMAWHDDKARRDSHWQYLHVSRLGIDLNSIHFWFQRS